MDSVRVARAPRSDVPSEGQSYALARVYARALQRYQEKQMTVEPAPEPDGRNNAAIVTERERSGGVDRNKETKEPSYQGTTKGR